MKAIEKLKEAVKKNGSILCAGLDVDLTKTPKFMGVGTETIVAFNKSIIDATKDLVCAYKPNFAFYESFGAAGFKALEKTMGLIPEDIFLIADAKRGDIGNTSKAYARSIFEELGADAATVNPYMGFDAVAPFLEYSEKFVFVLVLTSNKSSAEFQKLDVSGEPLYKIVAEKSSRWAGPENLGFVVGASNPEELRELRELYPDRVFLIPGIGAQGGSIERTLEANAGGPAVVNVSRAILYASDGKDFAKAAREKAIFYKNAFSR